MMEPAHPTEQYIERRVAFHESGAYFYAKHGQTELASWAKKMAAQWREKLPKIEKREAGDGE